LKVGNVDVDIKTKNSRRFSSMADILEDRVMMADRRVAEFLPVSAQLPVSLRTRLNEDSEWRFKSLRFMPVSSEWNGKLESIL
jgi:hypothetical protein